jgi:hypothetical protein
MFHPLDLHDGLIKWRNQHAIVPAGLVPCPTSPRFYLLNDVFKQQINPYSLPTFSIAPAVRRSAECLGRIDVRQRRYMLDANQGRVKCCREG